MEVCMDQIGVAVPIYCCVRDIPCLDVDQDTNYPDSYFSLFSSVSEANYLIII
jgi:hypothetical protein